MIPLHMDLSYEQGFKILKDKIFFFVLAFFMLGVTGCNDSGSDSKTANAVRQYLESQGFAGTVLIKRNGADIFRESLGFGDKAAGIKNDISTRLRIGSLTKAFTALCIVLLHDDGLLDYNEPLSDFMPDYPYSDKITIRYLLSQQSGYDDYIKYVDENEAYTPEQLLDLVRNRPLAFEPGTGFGYSNTNYVMLGCIVEALSGEDYMDYLEENVLIPLGMINTEYGKSTITGPEYAKGYMDPSQDELAPYHDMSIPWTAGALSSNIRDMELWVESFFHLTLIAEQDREDIFRGDYVTDEWKYGFAWYITTLDNKTVYTLIGSINGFTSEILMFPNDESYIVILGNINGLPVEEMGEKLWEIALQ